MRNLNKFIAIAVLALYAPLSFALTKPGPDANIENLSYVFYLYYDNGQLFGDRDYDVKFDVIDELFSPQSIPEGTGFKGVITNFKSEMVKTFFFDPRQSDPNFSAGKIQVKGPYVSDGQKVTFYNVQDQELVTIYVVGSSICNDDGACDSAAGENEMTCLNDCKKPKATPVPATIDPSAEGGFFNSLGFDLNSILIVVVSVLGVGVVGWLIWKRWKKHRESAFIPAAPIVPPAPPGLPTPEQMDQESQNPIQ